MAGIRYYASKSLYSERPWDPEIVDGSVAREVAWQQNKNHVERRTIGPSIVAKSEGGTGRRWSPLVDGLNEGETEDPYTLADVIRGHTPSE